MAYYSDVQERIVHNVLMARSAGDPEPALLGLRPQLLVRDVEHTTRLLVDGLGLHLDTRAPGTSPEEKRLAISAFAGAPAIAIRAASASESIPPATIELDVGGKVDEHAARCRALGMRVGPPKKVHWYRCYEVDIGDGHRIRLRGSKHPGLHQ